MSPSASQPLSTAPGLEPTSERREPLPSGGAPPGAPPEGPPFHSALATEWARTAIAEGQQQNRSQHTGHRAAATPSGAKATAGLAPPAPTPDGTTITPAAAPGRTPPDEPAPSAGKDVDQSPAARLDAGQPDLATARGGGSASSAGAGALTAAAVAREDRPTSTPGPTDDALATSRDVASTHSAPTDIAPTASGDGNPRADANASTLAAAAKDTPTVGEGASTRSTPPASPAGAPLTPHGSSTLSAGARNAGAHDKLWVANPAQASPAGTATGGAGTGGLSANADSALMPAAADGNPAPPAGELAAGSYGVGLQEAIESLHGTIQLAARQGLTQARISLQPEELGEIRINLTQTAQGLLARVTAESPAAAQALAAAHAQLRQSLSSLGVNLTRLDIGHHDSAQGGGADAQGGSQGGAARGEGFAGGRPGRSTATTAPADPETETGTPAVRESAPATPAPAHGTLIDVLA